MHFFEKKSRWRPKKMIVFIYGKRELTIQAISFVKLVLEVIILESIRNSDIAFTL